MNNLNPPKYQVIREDLRKLALSEKVGFRIPTIAALNKQYGVSTTTTFKAITELINAGYLDSIQGNGTFVSKTPKQETTVGSRNIGVVVTDSVFDIAIRKVTLAIQKQEYNTVLVFEENDRLFGPHSNKLVQDLSSGYYDGLLLISPLGTEDINRLLTFDVPFVCIFRVSPDERIYSVLSDHYFETALSLSHCKRMGCKNILFISGPLKRRHHHTIWSAYRSFMITNDFELKDENFHNTEYRENQSYDQAYDIVRTRYSCKNNRPDAIVTYDWKLANAACRALDELGIKVPDDVIMVQRGEIFTTSDMRKRVSYVDLHLDQIYQKASEMLIKLVQGEEVPEKVEYVYPTFMECPVIKAESKILA